MLYQHHHKPLSAFAKHYCAAASINHLNAVTHSSNISITVHHLRLGEMKVIHSKMDHVGPACPRDSSTVDFWVIFQVYLWSSIKSNTPITNLWVKHVNYAWKSLFLYSSLRGNNQLDAQVGNVAENVKVISPFSTYDYSFHLREVTNRHQQQTINQPSWVLHM